MGRRERSCSELPWRRLVSRHGKLLRFSLQNNRSRTELSRRSTCVECIGPMLQSGNTNRCRRARESFSKSRSNAASTARQFSHVGRCARNSSVHGMFEKFLQGWTPSGFIDVWTSVVRGRRILGSFRSERSKSRKSKRA
jgi:hypothetical protein